MFVLAFHRCIAADPAAVWTMLAEPAAINQWSTARVDSLAPGDGGHPCGVGALRRITLPHRAGALTEVIERVEPGRRIEYRVIAGAPVVRHHGTIALDREAGDAAATTLAWTVEIEPVTRVLVPVMRALLVRELERSLDRLVASAPSAVPGALPPTRVIDPGVDLARLRRDALAIAAHQGDIADQLLAAGDPRGHFARVYQYVTEGQIAAVDAGRFDHPAWVLRLIPVFDRYFVDNLHAAVPELHWARAFAHVARARSRGVGRFELVIHAVYAGMRAHIEEDLPRTLARVYLDHYASACDHVRFRADYLRMDHVFTQAGDRLMADTPRRDWTPRARLIDRITPVAMRDRIIDRYLYPITKQRARAFERAALLAQFAARAS